ncbi:zinc ribbon domain-containing protein [Chitinispirillales bacterium ANBcel5]|uniref:zinc ribbon domain-containing protein n=1 Tax=Cellulosispirillum alkaliphilum TaxID=3039283 RepID=UPI002A58311D|nr:zinc ribbon domain-containing protein [Chitinispirillales bacterium ANBcel5]
MDMQQKGPFCQSCAMPMQKPEDFGTEATGVRSNDYCVYCFKDGTFTAPDITKEQMIEFCVTLMDKEGIMPKHKASAMLNEVIPKLKRWQ